MTDETDTSRTAERGQQECTEASLLASFEDYEDALVRHDTERMNAWFSSDEDTVRFGVAEEQWSGSDIAAWRRAATPVPLGRMHQRVKVTWCSPTVAIVNLEFTYAGSGIIGRQSQVWSHDAGSWRIVGAHVSHREPTA